MQEMVDGVGRVIWDLGTVRPSSPGSVSRSARLSRWVLAELGQAKPCAGPIPEKLECN